MSVVLCPKCRKEASFDRTSLLVLCPACKTMNFVTRFQAEHLEFVMKGEVKEQEDESKVQA